MNGFNIPTVAERRKLDAERERLANLDKEDGGKRLLAWTIWRNERDRVV